MKGEDSATRGFIVTASFADKTVTEKSQGGPMSIGRSEDCDVYVPVATLSRKHATISQINDKFFIVDHGSSNGTFIGLNKIKPGLPELIEVNQVVLLGKKDVRVKVSLVAIDEVDVDIDDKSSKTEPSIHVTSAHTFTSTEIETKFRRNTESAIKLGVDPVKLPEFKPTPSPTPVVVVTPAPAVVTSSEPSPETKKASENIILEAQRKASALLQAAEVKAEEQAKEIYNKAQERLEKAEETYQQRINKAYQEVEEIYSKAQSDSQSTLQDARNTADKLRKEGEEFVAQLRLRTEEKSEQVLEEARKSSRELKERRMHEVSEIIQKKTEEMEKALQAEHDDRISRLEKDWSAEQKRRQTEFEDQLSAKHESADSELSKLLAQIEEHKRLAANLTQSIQSKKTDLEEVQKTLIENTKIDKALDSQMGKVRGELALQIKKLENVKSDLQLSAKEYDETQFKLKTAQDNLRKKDGESKSAIKDLEDKIKFLTERAKTATADSTQMENTKNQKKMQLIEAEEAFAKAQSELKSLQEKETSAKKDADKLLADVVESRKIKNLLIAERNEAEVKGKEAQEKFASLVEHINQSEEKLQHAKSEFDTKLLKIREKFENNKDSVAKLEQEHFEQMKLETMRKVRQYEMDMLEGVAINQRNLSGELTLKVEAHMKENAGLLDSKRLQGAIDRGLSEYITQTEKNDPTKAGQASLVQLKKRERIRTTASGFAMGAIVIYIVQFAVTTIRENNSPMQRRVAAMVEERKQDLEKRKFSPAQTPKYKQTYIDNVVYTDKFVSIYLNEQFQKDLLKALTGYMFKTWRLDEDKDIELLSVTTTLVKTLDEKREAINPDFVPQSLEKMKAVETESIKKMSDLLGSQVRYESFKKFEQQFYESYSPKRAAASNEEGASN